MLATGIYTYDHLPQVLLNRDEDDIAAIFVHEIENGIQGTRHQAGLHQVRRRRAGRHPQRREGPPRRRPRRQADRPADHGPLAPGQRHRARADADLRRGGRRPGAVQIAHTGDTDDLDYIEQLLETGCWIGMDRYGLDIFLPTEKRNATVLALLERGYAERMFLSQDFCSTIDWFPREVQEYLKANEVPDWSMTFLFEQVIPDAQGGRDDRRCTSNQMMVENPKRWLGHPRPRFARAWCNGCTRAFQALITGSTPVARLLVLPLGATEQRADRLRSATSRGNQSGPRGLTCDPTRGVAQFGSAFGWGPKGRWFKSSRPD